MLIIIERKCTRHVLDCKLLFTHSDLQSWNWRVLCRNAPVPCSSFWTTGLQMLWLYSDLGESLKIKHCLSASSCHSKKKNLIFFTTLICRLQEVGEHVPRHGLQQHLGDAGCHDLWTKGHRRCHDIAERISADVPKVAHIFGERRKVFLF